MLCFPHQAAITPRENNRKNKAMKLNKTDWINTIKEVVAKTQQKPSSGVVCAIASIITIRDGILADMPNLSADDAEKITASCKELMKQVASESTYGFAANASAAAKAAGFDSEAKAATFTVDDF